MLKIEIKTDGAAFCDPVTGEEDNYYKAMETSRILENIQGILEDGGGEITSGTIMDINGNKVGTWNLD